MYVRAWLSVVGSRLVSFAVGSLQLKNRLAVISRDTLSRVACHISPHFVVCENLGLAKKYCNLQHECIALLPRTHSSCIFQIPADEATWLSSGIAFLKSIITMR